MARVGLMSSSATVIVVLDIVVRNYLWKKFLTLTF